MPAPNTPLAPSYQLTMKMAHHYYRMIVCAHHSNVLSQTLSTQCIPLGLSKIEHMVRGLIKPALPDETILLDIQEATHDWIQTITSSLSQHYNNTYSELGEYFIYPPDPSFSSFYPNSFHLATQWADKRYGKRLQPTILSKTETFIKAQIQQGNTSDTSQIDDEDDIQTNINLSPSSTPHTHLITPNNSLPLTSTGDLQVISSLPLESSGELGENVMKGHIKGNSPLIALSEPSLKSNLDSHTSLESPGEKDSTHYTSQSTNTHTVHIPDNVIKSQRTKPNHINGKSTSHTHKPKPYRTFQFLDPHTLSLPSAKINNRGFSPHTHNNHNHQTSSRRRKSRS